MKERPDLYLAGLLVAPAGFVLLTGPGVTKSLFYVAALGCGLGLCLGRTERPLALSSVFWWAVLLICWLTLSHLWSSTATGLEFIKLAATGLSLMMLLTLAARQGPAPGPLYRGLVVIGLSAVAMAGFIYTETHEPREHFGRLLGYGQLRNPVVAGAAFGFFTLIAVMLARQHKLWWIAATLLFLATLATGSRAPLIALCVAAFFGTQGFWRLFPALLFASALALPWLANIPNTALEGRDFTRLAIWVAVFQPTGDAAWIVGHGLGSPFQVVIDGVRYGHAHSGFVATFLHGGLIGLGLLTLLAAMLVRTAFRRKPEVRLPFLYGLVILLLDGSRIVGDINLAWLVFWLPAGLLSGRSATRVGDDTAHTTQVHQPMQ